MVKNLALFLGQPLSHARCKNALVAGLALLIVGTQRPRYHWHRSGD